MALYRATGKPVMVQCIEGAEASLYAEGASLFYKEGTPHDLDFFMDIVFVQEDAGHVRPTLRESVGERIHQWCMGL
ncbi:hypothetical protein [Selenomonas sp. TAMA-11512]|uniref:hypothetical protein n=1 Tax=Selenomonas sp. TAMA-11512 TaxID=3095337 RepID=UPI0030D38A75